MTEVLPTQSWQTLANSVVRWAKERPDVIGVALVGSWAHGTPRAESDVDLVLLVRDPEIYRESPSWLMDIPWYRDRVAIKNWHDAQYGQAWSRHVHLEPGGEIELTFCAPSWAADDPPDPGTVRVVQNGCHILLDKEQRLAHLITAVGAANCP